jgi:2'-5' RNA ligase
MSTIALQLHEPAAGTVRGWWELLARDAGLRGVRRVPFPHVTLLGCRGIETPLLQEVLEELSRRVPPLHLTAEGLGIFLEPAPVLYVPVVRHRVLTELHQNLWQALGNLGGVGFNLYAPEYWMPHITLAQFDLERDRVPDAMSTLLRQEFHLEFEVRNLTLFDWIGPRYEPCERYPLLAQPFMER